MDGPNPGKGSCQGDSGGPLFVQLTTAGRDEEPASTSPAEATAPILVGSVVMGPECDKGLGYNTDLRQYVDWIKAQPEVDLSLSAWDERKADLQDEITRCP